MQALCPFLLGKSGRVLLWWALCCVPAWCWAQSEPAAAVHGHVLQSSSQRPLSEVLVMAWPCGLASTTDTWGAFRVACPHGVDSLTLVSEGHHTATVQLEGRAHVDVWLEPLGFSLSQATVSAVRHVEPEGQTLDTPELMQALDNTPGLQSLDLGAGMIQPVVRGLFGSRVAVLEDGVPQQGGRWGSDHGVLVAPELQVASSWVPGGGQVWMGPEAVAGGLRFQSPSILNTEGQHTSWGSRIRWGQTQAAFHVLHRATTDDKHWHAGISTSAFGASQVPQREFTYLDRTYTLETGELPNTAGRAGHAVLGLGRWTEAGRHVSWSMRVSDVRQGMFPGIVGLPMQGDLAPNDGTFEVRLPSQHASRLQSLVQWSAPQAIASEGWVYKVSTSWNRRQEFAPPHAHGWGPLPSSDLSLSLEELAGFAEARHTGAHGSYGAQAEVQHVTTTGWEFLLPSHRRARASFMGETRLAGSTLSGRVDVVQSSQVGHTEPQFNAAGDVVGDDVRATPFAKTLPGGMLSWQTPLQFGRPELDGLATVVAYGRVPSNHEWGANGIHHGSFRFEQGNPNLSTEWALEGRGQVGMVNPDGLGWSWQVQGFVALHAGFISLTPSAHFAPVAHAGQIYEFMANDAFRTGAEWTLAHRWASQELHWSGSVLGQWELQTGLGLPFTTPAQSRLEWSGGHGAQLEWSLGCRALAPAVLTARNEASTPGAVLADVAIRHVTKQGVWALEVQNAFNQAWLDHVSAYRILGLVAQGRWVQLSFNATLKPNN